MINHGPVVLVTCGSTPHNIITVAWITPVSHTPPLLAISVGVRRYSRELIDRIGEFVVNVPSAELLGAVWICGTRSGRDIGKFEEAGLTPIPSENVIPPCIAECMAWLECGVRKRVEVGDHVLFVGEVLSATARADAFNRFYRLSPHNRTLHHLGGDHFAIAETVVEAKERRPD